MQDSPHAARWINLLTEVGWEIMIFPINSQPKNSSLSNLVNIYQDSFLLKVGLGILWINDLITKKAHAQIHKRYIKVFIAPFNFIEQVVRGYFQILDKYYCEKIGNTTVSIPKLHSSSRLVKCILNFKPDLIHSLELQHCAYLVLAARDILGKKFPIWAVTNWGSDIYHFQHKMEHLPLIRQVLEKANYYFCECERDIELANKLGFRGHLAPVGSNIGGFDLGPIKAIRNSLAPSKRGLILIKGYESFSGRALTALMAIQSCSEYLKNYQLIVYSASPVVRKKVRNLNKLGLNIQCLERVSYSELMNKFALARIYIGVGVTDGISTSMLEAMTMGAFPIQTHTACCSEWIEDGKSGYIVDPNDMHDIANKIKSALADDVMVDQASQLNWVTAEKRLNLNKNKIKTIEFYSKILYRP